MDRLQEMVHVIYVSNFCRIQYLIIQLCKWAVLMLYTNAPADWCQVVELLYVVDLTLTVLLCHVNGDCVDPFVFYYVLILDGYIMSPSVMMQWQSCLLYQYLPTPQRITASGYSVQFVWLCGLIILIIMSPLRRHIFVCFMAKSAFGGFFGDSSVKRGRTHIVLG